ncbi:hypothetical protein [Gracilibacillus xinjiangensis]|uniref:Uncharacterized protein n=1 Tax=Gracilibacillus xinjiangensis TaxID=1193282 RepID=A0ABV8WXB4_9BACI
MCSDESDNLASEKSKYEVSKNNVLEYLDANNIPEEVKNLYPVYETYNGLHPKYIKEAITIFAESDPIVNQVQLTSVNIDYKR